MQFTAKLDESIRKSGVKIVGYLDGPGYVWYFIIDVNDNTALNNAVEPLRLVGNVRFAPVMKYSDAVAWAKKIGIQEK